jgi:hypothetical protein
LWANKDKCVFWKCVVWTRPAFPHSAFKDCPARRSLFRSK